MRIFTLSMLQNPGYMEGRGIKPTDRFVLVDELREQGLLRSNVSLPEAMNRAQRRKLRKRIARVTGSISGSVKA